MVVIYFITSIVYYIVSIVYTYLLFVKLAHMLFRMSTMIQLIVRFDISCTYTRERIRNPTFLVNPNQIARTPESAP